MVKALKALDTGELRSDEWTHAEGVVLYRGRVYVLDNPQLHHDLVHAHHSAVVIGHPGHWKMLELVSQNYWWCHAPSWLNPGEPSYMHIHLTMDHDSTQLNALPRMGNAEYSPTRTSPTSMDISGQAGMAH